MSVVLVLVPVPGGLNDVEWTVQLLQLQHTLRLPSLRVTGTMPGLDALSDAGMLPGDDARALREAWQLGQLIRNASVLWRGRPVDSIPSDLRDLDGIGRLLAPPGQTAQLEEIWSRVARRARQATQTNFYGSPPGSR